eukprot:scaffold75964_cov23-Tisochrysis_lutea.AAC.1
MDSKTKTNHTVRTTYLNKGQICLLALPRLSLGEARLGEALWQSGLTLGGKECHQDSGDIALNALSIH